MTTRTQNAATNDGPSRLLRILVNTGLVVFFLGALLPLLFGAHTWILAIRWVGLAAMTIGGWKRSLTYWIFVSMLVGAEIGFDQPAVAEHLRLLSDIFLRLIKVIVAPLILGTLITGIAGHGNLKAVGRIGWKSLVYFEVVTTIALFIGLTAIDLSRAGVGVSVSAAASAAAQAPAPMHWNDFILHIFPENIAKSIADNQILQVAVFAVMFGIALALVPETKRKPMLNFCESLTDAMFAFTNIVMYFAPFGVGAAIAYTVGHLGVSVLLPLLKLLVTGYAALIVFVLIVLLPIAVLARLPLRKFIAAIGEPTTIAFATSSSEAALPLAMERMEEFGVSRRIVAFVIPAGYSFNLAGSTVYLAVASLFVAQVAGIPMSWSQQLFMVFVLMLTSKGVAGVPRAVIVVLLATAGTFSLPTEPIFMILGIDALMDMARTAINVIGNCLAAAVIARTEGELSPAQLELSRAQ
jgi:proton glutamate symport protein